MAEAVGTMPPVDTTNCDREPIHIPGAILPHGVMLVLDAESFEIIQAAGDTQGLLDMTVDALLGHSAEALFRPSQVASLRALAANLTLEKPRHLLDASLRVAPDRPLDASLHRSGGSLVLEFEAADLADPFAADPLAGVHEMVQGLDAAISLQALCQLAAERVRGVARYDRVLVYKFMQDGSGWVIAESREAHLEPFLDLHYPAADIPQQARALYVKNWLRLITQVNYTPAQLTPLNHPGTGQPLDMSQAILRDVSPIHRQYLRNMGIDASMSISIILGGKLWGLIACHHYSPRILPRHLRAVCELFGSMFSLQLETREKGEQFEERLASRTVLQSLMLNLASADDYAYGLMNESPNLLDYIRCGEHSPSDRRAGGVAVRVRGQLTFLGATPTGEQITSLCDWLTLKMARTDGVFSTDRLSELCPEAAGFAGVSSGILAISVSHERSDFIIWFRPELVGTTSWAGEPVKLHLGAPGSGDLSPRRSFEVWKEAVRGRCLPWSATDLDAAFDLRVSLLHVVLRRITVAAEERRRVAERDQLLMAELDHRVKNTIANIQALVVHTSQSAESLTGFVEGLSGRIQSMAKAHSLLSQSRWEGVSIDKLLREELGAYVHGPSIIELDGAEVLLTPKSALSLSLAVHELVTNAAKYGSLSCPGGSVTVRWVLAADGSIHLSWTEAGGPPVAVPIRRGFGSTLIEQALAMETDGQADVQYLAGGVVCAIHLPASAMIPSGEAEAAPLDVMQAVPAIVVAAAPSVLRILVVEDSFLIVMTLRALFDKLGWVVVGPASRKAAALALARSEDFDAALLDINLHGEMSWDIALLLRGRGIPFVFSTGYDVGIPLPAELVGSPVIGKLSSEREIEQQLRRVVAEGRMAAVV